MSWLVREAESRDDLLVTAAHELGGDGVYVALPLRRENSALTGFLVLRSPSALPASRRHRAQLVAGRNRARAGAAADRGRAGGDPSAATGLS